MITTKTSHFNNINDLSLTIFNSLEQLCQYFNFSVYEGSVGYIGICPVHGGDNNTALLINDKEEFSGTWRCWTHQCHEHFGGNMVSFIRGLLSHEKYNWTNIGDKEESFQDTVQFIYKFLSLEPKETNFYIKENKEKNDFINYTSILNNKVEENGRINRIDIQHKFKNPSQYYLERGYSEGVLRKYEVFDCWEKGKKMYARAVVPVYDNDLKYYMGCTGRTILKEQTPKWLHSKGLQSGQKLYNLWYAKKYIKESREIVLVESPGNVWRLNEAEIYNSVAMFGSSLSDNQKLLLDSTGALTIVVIADNDKAVKKCEKIIEKKCGRTYNIEYRRALKNDIGEMSVSQIRELFNV